MAPVLASRSFSFVAALTSVLRTLDESAPALARARIQAPRKRASFSFLSAFVMTFTDLGEANCSRAAAASSRINRSLFVAYSATTSQ